jgi:signal transduction histidine kinase/ActR/RegA family two-component response regulator
MTVHKSETGVANDHCRAIFQQANQPIAVFTPQGVYEEGNLLAEELWALPGSSPPDFSSEGPFVNTQALEAFRRSCAGHIGFVRPFEYLMPSGRVAMLQLTLKPLLPDPNDGKIVVTVEDVTEVVEQRRALQDAILEKEKAAIACQDQEAFVSVLAHEMRNPLSGIFGITELLATNPELVTPDLLDKLHACSMMLSALIDDTLDLSRMEQKRLRLDERVFHLGALLAATVEVHASEAEAEGVTLSLGSLPEELSFVRGDDLRIRQILVNLLTNAIKYTPAGGSVSVDCSLVDESYLLKVADTGVGISETNMRTIFEPYFQVTRVGSGSKRGIGLGLSIVRSLVDLMQGAMGADSVVGQGSTFWVSLRLPKADPPELAATALGPLNGRILVVDDNVINRSVLELQLAHFGASVTLAQNGREALLALIKRRYDIVLMDCHMPIMDGYEATQQIKASPEKYGAPTVIALTASATDNAKQRCLDAGMDEFLCKPVRQQDLHTKLSAYLQIKDSNLRL